MLYVCDLRCSDVGFIKKCNTLYYALRINGLTYNMLDLNLCRLVDTFHFAVLYAVKTYVKYWVQNKLTSKAHMYCDTHVILLDPIKYKRVNSFPFPCAHITSLSCRLDQMESRQM